VLIAREVVADLPGVFVEAVGEGPMAHQTLQRGGVIESRIIEFDTKEDGLEGPGLLSVEEDFGLAFLADLVKDVFFVGVFAHLLNENGGFTKGAPGERSQEFHQDTVPLEQALARRLPEVVAM